MQIFTRVQIELLSRWCTCLLRVIIPLSRVITRVVNGWKGDRRISFFKGRPFEHRGNILSENIDFSVHCDNVGNHKILTSKLYRIYHPWDKKIRILINYSIFICIRRNIEDFPKFGERKIVTKDQILRYDRWRILQQDPSTRSAFKVPAQHRRQSLPRILYHPQPSQFLSWDSAETSFTSTYLFRPTSYPNFNPIGNNGSHETSQCNLNILYPRQTRLKKCVESAN